MLYNYKTKAIFYSFFSYVTIFMLSSKKYLI